ncbi:hypothetical protein COEREDRAFT_98401 [Coemansia reversa NRRL 1564]|uniref:Uncharacterized protein n=1 Tax=Coemansia reversa (strain ATCC 12441 / NRRL 1564) TaxID=763665 RepID=A0A2G5B7Q5_COERN|nr:hypothetical protein COEREDRAFT_98401 [Coemansia reversa NRRL 1564]|eukprot:PIA15031.1 hypothetical protein COEREDRAFT_98401 [Coemansia reversa NRRL 1564]
MGMLSAQIAHVQYHGLLALTAQVKNWSIDYFSKIVLKWAEHVDLTWTTLTEDEKTKTLRHVEYLLQNTTESKQFLTSPYMKAQLPLPGISQQKILSYLITNEYCSHELRIFAIHQYVDNKSIGTMVSEVLNTEYYAMKKLTTLLSKEIENGLVVSEKHKICAQINMLNNIYPLGFDIYKALNSECIIDIKDFLHVLVNTSKPELCNSVLFCVLLSKQTSLQSALRQQTFISAFNKELIISQDSIKYLDTFIIANLGHLNIINKYIDKIIQLTNKCQLEMLKNGSECLVECLVGIWQNLFLVDDIQEIVREALHNQKATFENLLHGMDEKHNPLLGPVKEFWSSFYCQLLQ